MAVANQHIEVPLPGGGTMKAYLARPESDEKLPAVIVFMEIFGINSHIRDVTDRVAGEGFVAFAPDYFHRTGPGMELDYDDAGMAMQAVGVPGQACVPNLSTGSLGSFPLSCDCFHH